MSLARFLQVIVPNTKTMKKRVKQNKKKYATAKRVPWWRKCGYESKEEYREAHKDDFFE